MLYRPPGFRIRPKNVIPRGRVRLDRLHPLAGGLTCALILNNIPGQDGTPHINLAVPSDSFSHNIVSGRALNISKGARGSFLNGNGSSFFAANLEADDAARADTLPATYFFVQETKGSGIDGGGAFFAGNASSDQLKIPSAKLVVRIAAGDRVTSIADHPSGQTTFAYVQESNTQHRIYFAGIEDLNTSTSNFGPLGGMQHLFSSPTGDRRNMGFSAYYEWMGRQLTEVELRALHEDPWSLFIEESEKLFFLPPAGPQPGQQKRRAAGTFFYDVIDPIPIGVIDKDARSHTSWAYRELSPIVIEGPPLGSLALLGLGR